MVFIDAVELLGWERRWRGFSIKQTCIFCYIFFGSIDLFLGFFNGLFRFLYGIIFVVSRVVRGFARLE